MLIDCYPREDIFARVPKMTERIDPVLQQLDPFLEDDEVYQQVRNDFGKRYRQTLVHGRHSTPVEVLLRMPLLKHLFGWSRSGRPKIGSTRAWCCAGSVASSGNRHPTIPP
jgi:IS5 family transposase